MDKQTCVNRSMRLDCQWMRTRPVVNRRGRERIGATVLIRSGRPQRFDPTAADACNRSKPQIGEGAGRPFKRSLTVGPHAEFLLGKIFYGAIRARSWFHCRSLRCHSGRKFPPCSLRLTFTGTEKIVSILFEAFPRRFLRRESCPPGVHSPGAAHL
jgi:hypothetical protein